MSVTLRDARPGDRLAVLQLLSESALPHAGVPGDLNGFIVADEDGSLVGVVGVERCGGEYGLLRSAAVAEQWRGRGLGRQLVDRAIAESEARGVRALYLLTTTAEEYFPNFGFTRVTRDDVPDPVKATEEFRGACPASATVMALELA